MKTLVTSKQKNEQSQKLRDMGITLQLTQIPCRTDKASDQWSKDARHFHMTITRTGKKDQIAIEYSQGSAIKTLPDIEDIVFCLLGDSDPVINGYTFEEWASNFGYDVDSRSAEKIYRSCVDTGKKMLKMFSRQEIEQLQELFQDY